MKLTHTILAASLASALALSLSACGHHNQTAANEAQNNAAEAASAASAAQSAASTATEAATTATAAAASTAMMPASSSSVASMVARNQQAGDNWFGGPVYNGKPDLKVTAALVKAGGGADNFSFQKALVSMLGEKTVNDEVAKLTQQYGKQNVDDYISGMTFVVQDGLKQATEHGVKLPAAPADLHGKALAKAVVKAGTAPDGTFWSGYLFDQMISHNLHNQVMADIDAKDGQAADANTHKIDNQAMYDVAQALGEKDVKLAPFH
ncbi:MAG: hypothetical protein ACREP2_15120 [Rhodanobacteraceae bacterium]